jgi:phage portal protein BeeE
MGFIDYIGGFFGNSRQSEKQYFNSRIEKIGGRGAVYLDTNVPYNLVNSIPHLKTATEKLGSMFSNMRLVKEDIKTGKEVEDPELFKLLENPNVLQSQNDYLSQYITQLIVYGNQFQYRNKASKLSKYPSALMNISAAHLTPILTGKYFDQIDLKGIISHYEYRELSSVRKFDVEDILWNKIADLDNPLVGCSPLKSLKYPLTNTKYAYDYLNVISADKGAIGILSTSQKDGMGAIPMTPEEKSDIEKTYRNDYGTGDGQKRIHITEGTTTWTPMTYPTGQLLLLEQIDKNFEMVLDVLGINKNIFINSTYENLKHGLILTYQDTIIPYADEFTQSLSKFLNIEPGYRLVGKFDHISILKDDESKNLANFETKSKSLRELVTGGIITAEQANSILADDFKRLSNQV